MLVRNDEPDLWKGRMTPFEIVKGVYFAGCEKASSHIFDTGDGLIMLDTGYYSTAHLLVNSIYELGFKPSDVKYIINSHWHWDHTEATAAIANLCGAKTLISEYDYENAKQYFDADILIKDGDRLKLGNIDIEFMHTPGHTHGTISLFFNVKDGDKVYRVGNLGGSGVNTMALGCFDFPNAREAFRNSLHKLAKEEVDVFIGNHTWNNKTKEKYEILVKTGENKFVDKNAWKEYIDFCERCLDNVIKDDNKEK